MTLRLFFATDIHGSDTCFRKFVGAPRHYRADVAILGGDLTGKSLVSIKRLSNGAHCAHVGNGAVELGTRSELHAFRAKLAAAGVYTTIELGDTHESDARSAPLDRDTAFRSAVEERMKSWLEYIEARRDAHTSQFYWMPGNDDPYYVDPILSSSPIILNIDGAAVSVGGGFALAGLGCSNPTPWRTPREFSEKELLERLTALSVHTAASTPILSIHVPPLRCGLDDAPALDHELRVRYGPGGVLTSAVGSSSVRRYIEETQPTLVLCGHVHEARGYVKLGRTLCVNPGSSYATGVLQGVLLILDNAEVREFHLTEG